MAIRITRKVENEKAMAELKAMAVKPKVDWVRRLNTHSRGVADAMSEIHGGHWRVVINHQTCFVLVSREIPGWGPDPTRLP